MRPIKKGGERKKKEKGKKNERKGKEKGKKKENKK